MEACVDGRLDQIDLEFEDNAAVCVVLASDGYPVAYEKGFEIQYPEQLWANMYIAGAKTQDGRLLTNGGRVLGATCVAESLECAVEGAYSMVDSIHFENAYYRRDIGARAMKAGRE